MKRFFLIALALPSALLAGKADPGAPVVAADAAYDRAARQDGTWTATRAIALPQSEMFIPERVKTLEYGAKAPNPPWTTTARAEHAWISCDGTIGVTQGKWTIREDRDTGWYEIIWAKMRNGSYRILLQNAGKLPRRLFSRPGRKGMRAACTGKPPPLPILAPAVGTDLKLGASHDQTLIWSSAVSEAGEVRIVISLWDGAKHVPVLEDVAPAPAPR
jgi:hypothetical protein